MFRFMFYIMFGHMRIKIDSSTGPIILAISTFIMGLTAAANAASFALRLGLDSSDPDEFELRLRFLFAWLIMACKGLPDSLRFMSVERFFEIMIVIILIIFFFYVLLFLFVLGAPSVWKNMQSLSSCDLDCTLSFALLGAPW